MTEQERLYKVESILIKLRYYERRREALLKNIRLSNERLVEVDAAIRKHLDEIDELGGPCRQRS